MTIIYHNDNDGIAAAAIIIAQHKAGNTSINTNLQLLPVQYDTDWNTVLNRIPPGDKVFLLDFTPNLTVNLKALLDIAPDTVWIDHHERNYQKFPDYAFVPGIRDHKQSAALLAWNFTTKGLVPPPITLTLINEWDLHPPNMDKRAALLQHAMSIQDQSPAADIWQNLICKGPSIAANTLNNILNDGKAIQAFRTIQAKNLINNFSFHAYIDGNPCVAINTTESASVIADTYRKNAISENIPYHEKTIIATFHATQNDQAWKFELRALTDNAPNLAELAAKHTGGGHPKAAGFVTEHNPLEVLGFYPEAKSPTQEKPKGTKNEPKTRT